MNLYSIIIKKDMQTSVYTVLMEDRSQQKMYLLSNLKNSHTSAIVL